MKNFKKMMAILIVAVMTLMYAVPMSFAEGETNNLSVDGTISVTGLQNGDSVTFYRVLKFSDSASTTGGWVNDTGFNLTEDQIRKALAIQVTGTDSNLEYKQVAITTENQSLYGIDETLAGTIATMAQTSGVSYTSYSAVAANDGTNDGVASVNNPAAGLYVAIVTPAEAGIMYNPVFVGADYKNSNSSNTWVVSITDSYQPASMAKKGTNTVDKTITNQTNNRDNNNATANVGDKVSFQVKTIIPEFNNAYTKAVFKVTDQLTKGLDLDTSSIKVYKGSTAQDCVEANLLTSADTYSASIAYKLTTSNASVAQTPAASNQADGDSYVVDFYTQYLLGLTAKQPIIITYDATVLDTSINSVNIEDNSVTVNFSNNPTDEVGIGILKDETKNYTFDIDGNLLGANNWKTTEVVKVGLDKDGKELTETKELHTGQDVGALQGAKFKLYVPVAADTQDAVSIKNEAGTSITVLPYVNSMYTANTEFVSDEYGRITVSGAAQPGIRGLDAGTYYLVETEAPDGYIKAQNGVKIEIEATINDVEHKLYYNNTTGETANAQNQDGTLTEVKWTVPELTGYTVKMNGETTASYTMTNEKPDAGDTIVGAGGLIGAEGATATAATGKIQNKQGVELPSTGGMGTTLFYLIGAILIIGAGVLLVTRRRMSAHNIEE